MASFATAFKPAPPFRTALNLGAGLDIPTGTWYRGEHGESILIGGLHQLTGIGGRGNSFKTALLYYMLLIVLKRYYRSMGMQYDTEMSASIARMKQLGRTIGMDTDILDDLERFILTAKDDYLGNVWYDMLKNFGHERLKEKDIMLTVPVKLADGTFLKIPNPLVAGCDSLSQFNTDSVQKIQEKAEIGESDRNVEALRDAHAKDQMIKELPHMFPRLGIYGIFTAHVGDKLQLDPYAPQQKKLHFLKNGVSFKKVPENFTFLMNNVWYALSSEVLVNQGTKGPEYPDASSEAIKGDPELMLVTYVNLRGKGGITGAPISLLFSQREGLLPHLSQFHYIKTVNRFGLGGNDRNYFLELVPDVSMSRTTVRTKIEESPKVQRAVEFTCDLCQMRFHHPDLIEQYPFSPQEIYQKLKDAGYDWDRLLDTRSYWVFKEHEKNEPQQYLSTLDLLRMTAGEYHPWWYGDLPKDKKAA